MVMQLNISLGGRKIGAAQPKSEDSTERAVQSMALIVPGLADLDLSTLLVTLRASVKAADFCSRFSRSQKARNTEPSREKPSGSSRSQRVPSISHTRCHHPSAQSSLLAVPCFVPDFSASPTAAMTRVALLGSF